MVAGGIFTIHHRLRAGSVCSFPGFPTRHSAWATHPLSPLISPHTVHVEEHNIQCEFCHRNVTKGDAATVPAVETCLFCHKDISGRDGQAQTEIAKVQQYFADEEPIDWERVQSPARPRVRFRPRGPYTVLYQRSRRHGSQRAALRHQRRPGQPGADHHREPAPSATATWATWRKCSPRTASPLKMGTCPRLPPG